MTIIFNSKCRLFLYSLVGILVSSLSLAESLPDLYERLHTSVVVLQVNTSNKIQTINDSGQSQISTTISGGEGSGVLIAKNLILTAAHVVHGVDELQAIFYDGKIIPAKVISSDVFADLSLVELESAHPSFIPAKMGNSDNVRIGENVFVIGAPYNISYTLTSGIISGRHSQGSDADFFKSEFFQTDAALNPGNSGGPIFNMSGEVIGIASFIKSKSGGNEGLGFAVTINSAKKLMLERPLFYSGIDSYLVEGLLAKALNLPQPSGILVTKVAKGSLAEKIGLKGGAIPINYNNETIIVGGDIVLSIGGISTDSQLNLRKIEQLLYKLNDLKNHHIKVLRQGKVKTLTFNKS